MYNNKTQHKVAEKNSSKRAMLIFWGVASVLWLVLCANFFQMNKVVTAYKMYNHYELMIQSGAKSDYARKAYLRSSDHLREVGHYAGKFILLGFGMPGLMLALGTWLVRSSKT